MPREIPWYPVTWTQSDTGLNQAFFMDKATAKGFAAFLLALGFEPILATPMADIIYRPREDLETDD